MPPSAKRKDAGSSSDELRRVRDRELELKRMSGEISCSDCRRLKLKCDKKIPCSSCVRRGAESLCPLGPNRGMSGPGYQVAIADLSNQHSHRIERKLTLLTERVRALEDALALESEARGGSGSHPLLAEDLPALKQLANDDDEDGGSNEESYEEADHVLSTFGTLSIDESRTMRYIGPAGSESVLVMEVLENNSSRHLPITGPTITAADGLSSDIIHLSEAFPFTPLSQTGLSTLSQLVTHLPPFERATALYEAFFRNLAWIMAPVERDQIVSEVVPAFYPSRKPISPSKVRIELAHDLALLYVVFACGSVGDLTQSPINNEAERYHALAKAAMGVRSIMHGASLAGVQTTYLLGSYDIYSGRKSNMEDAWKLFALGGSLATAIGLHRDPSRWGFEPKIVERRRRIFWEIYGIDIWRSLESDRPSIFRSNVVDCEFPNDQLATVAENGDAIESVARFRYRFLRDVIVPYSEKMCSARSLKYRDILEIDRKIRDFPRHPSATRKESAVNALGIDAIFSRMYPALTVWEKEESLLYIHRNLFARAIIDFPDNPLRSPFGASFLTTYRSAVSILRICRENMEDVYLIVLRVWQLWSLCLICGVVVGAVASLGMSVSFATSAFVELEYAISLFEKYNEHKVARHGLPLLRQIREKAVDALRHPRKHHMASDNPSFRSGKEEVGEELWILRGSTRVIEQRSTEPSTTGNGIATSLGIVPGARERPELAHADLRFSSRDVFNTDIPYQPTGQNVHFAGSTNNGPSPSDPSQLSGSQYPPGSDAWLAELENMLGTSIDLQQPMGGTTFDWTADYSGPSSSTPDVSSAGMPSEPQGQPIGAGTLLPDTYLDHVVNTDDWLSLMRQCGYSSTPPFSVTLDQGMSMAHGGHPMQSTTPMYE